MWAFGLILHSLRPQEKKLKSYEQFVICPQICNSSSGLHWLISFRSHKMIGLNHCTNTYSCRPIWMVGRCILAFFFLDGCRSVIKFVNHACSQNEVEKEKILLQKMSRKSNHNIGFNKFCYPVWKMLSIWIEYRILKKI